MDVQLSLFKVANATTTPRPKQPTAPPRKPSEPRLSHDERLTQLNLRYGATTVYFLDGVLVGYGDVNHCPMMDIAHNLSVLGEYLVQTGARSGGLGKAYDSDTYRYGNVPENRLPRAGSWLKLSGTTQHLEDERRRWRQSLFRLQKTATGLQPRRMESSG